MNIDLLDPRSEGARALLTLSDDYAAALYPAESNHMESVDVLAQTNVLFLGGYAGNQLVACGAVKAMDDDDVYGEIKRVFVIDCCRGKGYSKKIMLRLEAHLHAQRIPLARLETGIKQPEALGLYRKLGYQERTPFGKYRPDPLSVFMEKRITL
jgi:putative acetyltransferase